MLKTVRKAFLLGLGAAALTKDRAEKFTKELVKQGDISSKEGRALVKRMMKDAEIHRKRMQPIIEKETKATVKRLRLVSKKEAKIMAKRIARIEKELKKKPKRRATKKKRKTRRNVAKKRTRRKKKR